MITPAQGGELPAPFLVGRMAVPAIRRAWARGALAVLNALVAISAALFVVMRSPHVAPSLRQVGDPLPPGAAPCRPIYTEITAPFNAGARGTPLTSCAFVEQVRWTASADHLSTSSSPTQLRAVSPITRKRYEMQCISVPSYVTCTSGEDAIVICPPLGISESGELVTESVFGCLGGRIWPDPYRAIATAGHCASGVRGKYHTDDAILMAIERPA